MARQSLAPGTGDRLGAIQKADDKPVNSQNSILGLDRKAMEQERLARLAAHSRKRDRSVSPPALSRPAKLSKASPLSVKPTVTKTDFAKADKINTEPSKKSSQITTTTSKSSQATAALPYPNGTVKKTWALGYPRTGTDIKIEEVLERHTLRTAVLSAFQWDTDWVLSKLNFPQTKLILVMQGKTADDRQRLTDEAKSAGPGLRLCFPSMEGQVNCMHSKLMLLFHAHKLRIVVPSANLVPYDWGETRVMENTVFLIDLPRLEDGKQGVMEELTPFGQELVYFLVKMGLHEDAVQGVLGFDFGATKGIAFVHAVGGVSYGKDMERTGHMGLSKAVRDLGLQTTEDLWIDFASASIGSLNDGFLQAIRTAARGTASPGPITSTKSKNVSNDTTSSMVRNRFRIYFPTFDTVKASNGGTDNGGTICLQKQWYTSPSFPKECFREYQSTRQGILSHNKLLYARGRQATSQKPIAWIYTGSANLSESAWGKVTMDRQRKEPKMSCRNWECGVLLRVSAEEVAKAGNDRDTALSSTSVFDSILGLPFKYPAEEYNGKQPWYFMEHR